MKRPILSEMTREEIVVHATSLFEESHYQAKKLSIYFRTRMEYGIEDLENVFTVFGKRANCDKFADWICSNVPIGVYVKFEFRHSKWDIFRVKVNHFFRLPVFKL